MPRRPLSPNVSTGSVTNGAASNAPFFITRTSPPFSVTNSRPSGANSIAVGRSRPPTRRESVKPDGSADALKRKGGKRTSNAATARTTMYVPVMNPYSDQTDFLYKSNLSKSAPILDGV